VTVLRGKQKRFFKIKMFTIFAILGEDKRECDVIRQNVSNTVKEAERIRGIRKRRKGNLQLNLKGTIQP
jgi:hypothetical protein